MRMPDILANMTWKEPSPVDHDAFHNRTVEWAEKMFNDKPAHIIMLGLFVMAGDGHATPIYAPWDSEDEKYMVASAMRRMMANEAAKERIEAYSFVTEAWALVQKVRPGEEPPLSSEVRPSEHPDREDVLQIFTTLRRTGETKITRFGVKTYPGVLPFMPPAKKPRLLARDDHVADGSTTMVGTMFNFFMSEKEMQREIDKAQAEERRERKRRMKRDV